MPGEINSDENEKTMWDRVAESKEFRDLMATKRIFIVPAFMFFAVYYFLLPVLVGYAPNFMSTKVWGNVNLAYLFALSQFFMAWIIAGSVREGRGMTLTNLQRYPQQGWSTRSPKEESRSCRILRC